MSFKFLLSILFASTAFAGEKSPPFFMAVTGRVCDANAKCERFLGDSGNYQVDLTTLENGDTTGALEVSYEIEGVRVTHTVHLSSYLNSGKVDREIFIEIKNSKNKLSAMNVTLKVDSFEQIPWLSPSGAAFTSKRKTIYPEIVIGPLVRK